MKLKNDLIVFKDIFIILLKYIQHNKTNKPRIIIFNLF